MRNGGERKIDRYVAIPGRSSGDWEVWDAWRQVPVFKAERLSLHAAARIVGSLNRAYQDVQRSRVGLDVSSAPRESSGSAAEVAEIAGDGGGDADSVEAALK